MIALSLQVNYRPLADEANALERAGVSRSAAMKLTGHKTEGIYRRYAIIESAMLAEGVEKLARLYEEDRDPAPKVVAMNA